MKSNNPSYYLSSNQAFLSIGACLIAGLLLDNNNPPKKTSGIV